LKLFEEFFSTLSNHIRYLLGLKHSIFELFFFNLLFIEKKRRNITRKQDKKNDSMFSIYFFKTIQVLYLFLIIKK